VTGTAKSSLQNVVLDSAGSSVGALPPALARALQNVPAEIFARADALAQEQDGQNVLRNILVREGRLPLPVDILTRMIDALKTTPTCRALVYGAGTGHATALLAHLVREVNAIEALPLLMSIAERTLGAMGLINIRLRAGDTTAFQEKAPFDVILLTYAVPEVPNALKQQLALGGRLVAPLGIRRKRQILFRITRESQDRFVEERLGELRFSKRLGDLLVESGAADRARVEQAIQEAGPGGKFLGETLHRVAQVSEADITRALATQRGMKFGTVDELTPLLDLDIVRSVPRTFLEHHRVIPIRRSDSTLELATCEPEIAVTELLALFRVNKVEFWLMTQADFLRLWGTIDLMASGVSEVVVAEEPKPEAELGEHDEHKLDQRFIDLFESMLLTAIGERASDIHLERYGEKVRVRIRVDGDLRDVPRYRLSPHDLTGIVNVIKIRSNLDIAEHRLPQGGRFRVTARGDTYDLRVQTQPSLHAEHVVIRLLPQKVKILTV
jgi:type IV pilus assembly protein PilB